MLPPLPMEQEEHVTVLRSICWADAPAIGRGQVFPVVKDSVKDLHYRLLDAGKEKRSRYVTIYVTAK